MSKRLFTLVILSSSLAFSQTRSAEDLSSLMGALSQVMNKKTKISGVNDTAPKLTPRAADTLKKLENDLEECQSSKSTEPEVVTVQKDGVSAQFKKFDLRIYGERCPLEMSAALQTTDQKEDKLAATFKLGLKFKSQAYIEKYKLRMVEVSGDLIAQAQKKDARIQVPVQLNIQGQGDSTEIGLFKQVASMNVLIEVNLAQFSFNLLTEQSATLNYQDVSKKAYSRVKIAGFTQPEAVYTIDDQAVSESEYQIFIQSFNLPGMVSVEDPNAIPDEKATTSCQFAVFDKNSISAVELKRQLQSSQLQPNGLLARGQSCMEDIQIPFQKDAQSHIGTLSFGTEWISLNNTFENKSMGSVYVLYGDQAPQATESETLVLGLQCKAVPACH